MHIIPHNLLSDETYVSSLLLSHTPHRSRTGTAGWGAWRMLRCVRERSRSLSPSQLWVARPLSPYNVIMYLFCTELLLYNKDVTFDPVPWFIICVRLGPSTPGDYVRARVLAPKPGCDTHQTVRCAQPTVAAGHAMPADCVADRWLTGQSSAPPDSPVNYSHVAFSVSREWRVRRGRLTGLSGAPPDSPANYSRTPLSSLESGLFMRTSLAHQRLSGAPPDSPCAKPS
jgi:hypothetical protein